MASGGGHVTAVSSYIAYARALNRLGWTPAEFVVAESFTVRLRGMLGRRPIAASGLPLVMAFPRCSSVHTCFMAYPIDIAFIDRNGNVLACYETYVPGVCVPAPVPGRHSSALQSLFRPLFSNACRHKNWRQWTFVIRNWVRWGRRCMDVEIHPNAKKHLTEKQVLSAWLAVTECIRRE